MQNEERLVSSFGPFGQRVPSRFGKRRFPAHALSEFLDGERPGTCVEVQPHSVGDRCFAGSAKVRFEARDEGAFRLSGSRRG